MNANSLANHTTICPQCETPIPPDAPGGICPGCMIDLGLSSGGVHGVEPTIDMPQSSSPSAAFRAPSAEDLNQLFEHLEIESLLGQGGMGAVYKARQVSLDRPVALKILPPYSGNDPAFQERFQREARALARLTHPNIVMVFEFGQVAELYYFVMEYVDGVNLREAIEAGGLTTDESLRVVPQICEALQFAHDEGIVHRDIKPENIMLDSKGRIKITDFGLAKLLESSPINFTLTSTNQVLGTVKYMAPEQIENPNTVDHRSDIYSLGVVFYELLTGELPLGRFDPPSASHPVNQPLDPVVMRTLEKQPSNRFQQASEVKTAVESVSFDPDQANQHSQSEPRAADYRTNQPWQAHPQGKAKSERSQTKRLPAVNFQMKKVFAGFGKGKGLLRLDSQSEELILDIEIKDCLGGLIRSEFKQVRISFDHILAFNSDFSWYSAPSLEIQTDYFQEFATLPGAENGKLDLLFNIKDKKVASALCQTVNERLGLLEPGNGDDSEGETEEPVDLPEIKQQLEGPAKGLWIAGIVDLFAAVIALLLSCGVALGFDHDLEIGPISAAVGVFFLCMGVFETYVSISTRSAYGYWTVLLGSLGVSLVWFHPGALFAIPSTIWLLTMLLRKRCRQGFKQSEQEQREFAGLRSIVYTDTETQLELKNQLRRPSNLLLITGGLSLAMLLAAGAGFVDLSPGEMENRRTLLLVFTVASFGVLGLFGAMILRFFPSPFWAMAVAKYCKYPLHLLFPMNFLIGRSIQSRLQAYETENFSRNPYVDKTEELQEQ